MAPPLSPEEAEARAQRMAEEARARRAANPEPIRPKVAPAPAVDLGPCPDPLAPSAPAQLYAAAFKRAWAILQAPTTTPQDVVSILSVSRLGARVGADKQPVKRARLRMESLLPPAPPPPGSTPS